MVGTIDDGLQIYHDSFISLHAFSYKSIMTRLSICMLSLMLLSVYMLSLTLIGQGTKTRFAPQVPILFILVKTLCFGVLKSNKRLLDPLLR